MRMDETFWARLPAPAEPGQAAVGLERWRERLLQLEDGPVRAQALALTDEPGPRRLLEALFGNSPFLGQCLLREPGYLATLLDTGFDHGLTALLAGLAAEAGAIRGPGEPELRQLMALLRQAKRRAALLIGLADIGGVWPLEQVTRALSDLAETTLGLATDHLLRRAATQGWLKLADQEQPGPGSGLIVLGMGKLGGRELNYSSDIDLIVLYDDELVLARGAEPDQLSRGFVRLARDLVRIMEERTAEGYVFRTDLRLRPDPGATPPAVSVSAAEVYYASVGQNWERAALIKARPVAGDYQAAAGFLGQLRPFIWRRNLDFAAIQDIHSIKRQINAHKGHHAIAINGHNIKLGRGGIREIEFFAQTQQLIFGGRDDQVRRAPTCQALRALEATGRIGPEVADSLIAAYRFLRRVEHRVQMIDDQQTHSLPADDAGVARLAVFLGYHDPKSFRCQLLGHLQQVSEHYARLFEEAAPLGGPGNLVFTGTDPDPATVETLAGLGFQAPEAVIQTVADWHRGRYRATRSGRARELLTELAPYLLEAFGRTTTPGEALANFDRFLGKLPAGIQLFSLFQANPKLIDLVAEIMGLAPSLAETLERNPALLDAVLLDEFFGPLPDNLALRQGLARALADARDFEDALLLSRRWLNDQKFRAGVQILRHVSDGDRAGPFLSQLADVVIAAMVDRVTEDFARQHGRFQQAELAVLALGKLGSRRMSVNSDLDLILVYRVGADEVQSDGRRPLAPSTYYTRLTQRLINALTAPLGEGRLYEVDMRLRPSGSSGPIAVSYESFVKYQQSQAWTWEHMALTRARAVTGADGLVADLEAAIRQVLTRPRDPDQLLRDVAEMRARIEREFGSDNPWNVKYARGGVIDITFLNQYLVLRHAHRHPEILSTETLTSLQRMAGLGLIAADQVAILERGQRLWRRLQSFLRLTVDPAHHRGPLPPALVASLARAAFPEGGAVAAAAVDMAELSGMIKDVAAAVYRVFQAVIEQPAAALPPLPDAETPADEP